jgi:hypothetical protein
MRPGSFPAVLYVSSLGKGIFDRIPPPKPRSLDKWPTLRNRARGRKLPQHSQKRLK